MWSAIDFPDLLYDFKRHLTKVLCIQFSLYIGSFWLFVFIHLMCLSIWLCHLISMIRDSLFWIFIGVRYFCYFTFEFLCIFLFSLTGTNTSATLIKETCCGIGDIVNAIRKKQYTVKLNKSTKHHIETWLGNTDRSNHWMRFQVFKCAWFVFTFLSNDDCTHAPMLISVFS